MRTWAEQLVAYRMGMRRRPVLERMAESLVAVARGTLEEVIVRRPYRYEQIGENRTWLNGRAKPLAEPARTAYAMATSDHTTHFLLANELPVLAVAARFTDEPAFFDRIRAQLAEMATWSPLQRSGWTLSRGGSLPPDGNDGTWLATGTGVRAIADTMEILSPGDLGSELCRCLHDLLAREIDRVVDDWACRRQWFVRSNNPITNQWVLPTEGLVRACLVLGQDRYRSEYELGVRNLTAALNSHGSAGEFEEGAHYGQYTVLSLLSVARAMAVAGDRRAIDHPFLQNFPTWLVHHYQPGGFYINCFDAFGAARGNTCFLRSLLTMSAVCTDNRDARWALRHMETEPEVSLPGLLCGLSRAPPGKFAPSTFAAYDRAPRVNWRSSWRERAGGFWIRGGHATDQHDHTDRGHVNFIVGGKPILIEAGTPAYHAPLIHTHYRSGLGHNVLQIGAVPPPTGDDVKPEVVRLPGWQKPGSVAPISVRRLDASGGDVALDGTACYDGLERWHRNVVWTARRIEVEDDIVLAGDGKEVILLRWHLGTQTSPRIEGDSTHITVSWEDATMILNASVAVLAAVEKMPDHTLRYRQWDDPQDHDHTCIVVRSAQPAGALLVRTVIRCPLRRRNREPDITSSQQQHENSQEDKR